MGNKGPHSLNGNSRGSFLHSPAKKCCLAMRFHHPTEEAGESSLNTGSLSYPVKPAFGVFLLVNKVSGLFYREMHQARGFSDKIMSRGGLYLLPGGCVTENKATSPFVSRRKPWQLPSIVSREVTSQVPRTNFYLIYRVPRDHSLHSQESSQKMSNSWPKSCDTNLLRGDKYF